MDGAAFDWQSWLACGLGLLAVLHLTRRWWPKKRTRAPISGAPATAASSAGCAIEAPSACEGGGCGACGTTATPIRVHRRTSRDNTGTTPGA